MREHLNEKEKPPIVHYNFHCRKNRQKMLIDAILKYSTADLAHIAFILKLPTSELRKVTYGIHFLSAGYAKELATLFLICFSD